MGFKSKQSWSGTRYTDIGHIMVDRESTDNDNTTSSVTNQARTPCGNLRMRVRAAFLRKRPVLEVDLGVSDPKLFP